MSLFGICIMMGFPVLVFVVGASTQKIFPVSLESSIVKFGFSFVFV